jgi:hypothetical protein
LTLSQIRHKLRFQRRQYRLAGWIRGSSARPQNPHWGSRLLVHSRTAIATIGLLVALVVMVEAYRFYSTRSKPSITIEKILEATGGKYSIAGAGYDRDETVSLEIKNAPLAQPSGWHLGNAAAANGRFSFQSEEFHCVRVDDSKLRAEYKKQRVVFVATGLNSGAVATAVDTAGGILMCP